MTDGFLGRRLDLLPGFATSYLKEKIQVNKKDGIEPARRLLSLAFEGDQAPAELSVGVVSLVELCQVAMPDPLRLRTSLIGAGFRQGSQKAADNAGRMLALDNAVIGAPVHALNHEIYGTERHNDPVTILVSEGESAGGKVIFVTALFRQSMEADVVKAVVHVSKKQPFTGAVTKNSDGAIVRRVFWDIEDAAGIRGIMVTGPDNVEAMHVARGITAFNKAATKR